jgi:hypothetical protein
MIKYDQTGGKLRIGAECRKADNEGCLSISEDAQFMWKKLTNTGDAPNSKVLLLEGASNPQNISTQPNRPDGPIKNTFSSKKSTDYLAMPNHQVGANTRLTDLESLEITPLGNARPGVKLPKEEADRADKR